jgi:hypothetical protein
MDLKNLKLKYILGSYKSDPNFPTIEDFEYFYLDWISSSTQMAALEQRRISENDPTGHFFVYNFLLQYLDNDKEKTDKLLNTLIESGNVAPPRKKVYKILKFDY